MLNVLTQNFEAGFCEKYTNIPARQFRSSLWNFEALKKHSFLVYFF
jgi:hypothetical protein